MGALWLWGLGGPPLGSSDPDFFQHAQKCPQLAAARSVRHHILCGAWCKVMQSTGVPTSLEPNCSKVGGADSVATAGARADILTVLQDLLLLLDASVTHCCADSYVERAAATAGSAAEVRAQKKVRKCALHGPGGYDFTPRGGILWPPVRGHARTAEQAGAPRRGQWPCH